MHNTNNKIIKIKMDEIQQLNKISEDLNNVKKDIKQLLYKIDNINKDIELFKKKNCLHNIINKYSCNLSCLDDINRYKYVCNRCNIKIDYKELNKINNVKIIKK